VSWASGPWQEDVLGSVLLKDSMRVSRTTPLRVLTATTPVKHAQAQMITSASAAMAMLNLMKVPALANTAIIKL